MAQRRKKKQPAHPSRRPLLGYTTSVTETNKAEASIRKVLQAYNLDPDLMKSFSKHQRWVLLQLRAEPIRFKVEKGHRVPRRIVDFVSESTHSFLRTTYFGDESIGLTYLELATYGMAFSKTILILNDSDFFPPEQMKVIRILAECFKDDRVRKDLYLVGQHVHQMVVMISKVNFRIYGFDWSILEEPLSVKSEIYLSSEEAVSIRFTHKQRERRAFCVRTGRLIKHPFKNVTIDRNIIFPKEGAKPYMLDIYIQSHALMRVKERMDIFPAYIRNFCIMNSFINHRVARIPSGGFMLECYMKDEDSKIIRFGYFPFIIQKNKLIVLTFLPLSSPETPEGKILQERLGLQIADLLFLGMDKLSFFITVDIEQIPILKDLFMDIGIWDVVEYTHNIPETEFTVDKKKTQMVKNFLERKPDEEPVF